MLFLSVVMLVTLLGVYGVFRFEVISITEIQT